MGVLAMEVLTVWSLLAVATGIAAGAVIHKADQMHKEEYLAAIFATLARQQAPR
jgi:hypothetical protein